MQFMQDSPRIYRKCRVLPRMSNFTIWENKVHHPQLPQNHLGSFCFDLKGANTISLIISGFTQPLTMSAWKVFVLLFISSEKWPKIKTPTIVLSLHLFFGSNSCVCHSVRLLRQYSLILWTFTWTNMGAVKSKFHLADVWQCSTTISANKLSISQTIV